MIKAKDVFALREKTGKGLERCKEILEGERLLTILNLPSSDIRNVLKTLVKKVYRMP